MKKQYQNKINVYIKHFKLANNLNDSPKQIKGTFKYAAGEFNMPRDEAIDEMKKGGYLLSISQSDKYKVNLLASCPKEIVIMLALKLPATSLSRLYRTDRFFNELLDGNNSFWREKIIQEFGKEPKFTKNVKWKPIYQDVWSIHKKDELSEDELGE